MPEDFEGFETISGLEVGALYGPDEGPPDGIGEPGAYPFTRGIHVDMYRKRIWTMRQYAGFGTAKQTNRRFQALLAAGQTGLSVAFDLPTQMGLDSDDRMASGEVGRVGVAIDTIDDMRLLFDDIPLETVTTSMTINATAAILLLLYQLVAEERGVDATKIRGTVQNDILKEYVARGTYIYPPRASMRLVTDLFQYAAHELPNWNTISISGYHMREAGATASQELAFTIANGLAYVEAAKTAGLEADVLLPRLSFFWNGHSDFFEEIAKFRAARRLWARLMRDRIGAVQPESWRMRFHTQTAGSSLAAQQPENNIVRTALQALAAVLGGTQSLHTNAFDEALGLPTDSSALLALRTQQIIADETGVANTVDPLGGSWFVEQLTDALEAAATKQIGEIDRLGGAVAGIEAGYQQSQIEDAAYEAAQRFETGEAVLVGVNRYTSENENHSPPPMIDLRLEQEQLRRLTEFREGRDDSAVTGGLDQVRAAARDGSNLLYPMRTALASGVTVGEVSNALRDEFGVYRPG